MSKMRKVMKCPLCKERIFLTEWADDYLHKCTLKTDTIKQSNRKTSDRLRLSLNNVDSKGLNVYPYAKSKEQKKDNVYTRDQPVDFYIEEVS